MRILTLAFTLMTGSLLSSQSMALEEIVGKIRYLEPTYLPESIRFNMDGGSASCPVGKALTYGKSSHENNMAIYSTLLAAFMGEATVRIYVEDGDTTCNGKYVHIIK